MEYTHYYESPLGSVLVAADKEGLTGLWLEGQRTFVPGPGAEHEGKLLPVFEQTDEWLDIYFSGREPDFTPKIHMTGTDFQMEVWKLLLQIPYGRTATYGELAGKVARQKGLKRMSAQAVGGAVGRNKISIIVPCHRVVGSNGSLTGYGGGIDKKVKLLTLERVDMERLFVPRNLKNQEGR